MPTFTGAAGIDINLCRAIRAEAQVRLCRAIPTMCFVRKLCPTSVLAFCCQEFGCPPQLASGGDSSGFGFWRSSYVAWTYGLCMFPPKVHCFWFRIDCEVWAANFTAMKFRKESSHASCSECIKHKSLIQSLAHHLVARRAQQDLYYKHLEAQFKDRIHYWQLRAESRNKQGQLTVIVDGMDQSKCCLPRHPCFKAKLFDNFMRPRLHLSAAIAHGHFVAIFITEADLPKDANFSTECVACALNLASKSLHLPTTDVIIQCDNTSRELKNGHFLRFCAAAVSNQTVRSMGVSCLRTGHSHEDIDQLFGQISTRIAKMKSVPSSEAFLEAMRRVGGELDRPHDKERYIFKVDKVRDWRPWLLEAIPTKLVGIGGPGAPHLMLFSRLDATGLP